MRERERVKERERERVQKKDTGKWLQMTDLPWQTVTDRRSETDGRKSQRQSDSQLVQLRCESATKRIRSASTKQMSAGVQLS